MKSSIAVIPARCGSKGLPDKNIKLLSGKPLMNWTIESAIHSGVFTDVVVSTDSEKYAEIAREAGASVPFLRPNSLATDTASTMDVIDHLLRELELDGKQYDYIAVLQPTSPLRTAEDIRNAYYQIEKKNAISIVSVCEAEHSPLWMNTLPEDFSMADFIRAENNNIPRQKLSKWYRLNGAIYFSEVNSLLLSRSFYGKSSFAYVMPQERSIDIDSILDFRMAEFILDTVENSIDGDKGVKNEA